MKLLITVLLVIVIALSVPLWSAHSNAQTPNISTPVVVELFTSQSCSSCPPADKVLGKLSQNPNVIALSCHVTYWDHLHWKDTLSQKFCTQRQRAYSLNGNRGGRIFTPEIIINGKESLIGSRERSVLKAINNQSKITPLKIDIQNENIVVTKPSNAAFKNTNSITFIAFGDEYTQHIKSGENRGRTVSYTNPIIDIQKIETQWQNNQISLEKPSYRNPVTGYAIFIHKKDTSSPIIAAGQVKIHN